MIKNFSVIFIIITVVIVGVFLLSYQKKLSLDPGITKEEMVEQQEEVTFLLLGKMGKVMGWNTAPNLIDAIVLVDYKPKSKTINLISIPRDLYVSLGEDKFKLNEVVIRNKVKEFVSKLPEISGLSTDKYIIVDIESLKNIVDSLNGIDINLDSDVIDNVTGFMMKAGQEHLTGEDAIWLVRNRFSPDGDFFREKNQHQVLEAIFYKYKNLNPIEKATFLFEIMPEISKLETNIDFPKFMPMIEEFNNVEFNDIVLGFETGLLKSGSIAISPTSTSTMYILIPEKGEDIYDDVKNFITTRLK